MTINKMNIHLEDCEQILFWIEGPSTIRLGPRNIRDYPMSNVSCC